ncbi:HlyD family efflux transporter periplasmic adaptor subunit [Rhizobium sp. ZPR3]|uniref:HlyD family efflux transporter periplasmic adaptor subunit n=2 Tax=unclassified Rhizobium TaxID=2613769 RepID=A0AAU7SRN4_9HYPH
MDSLLLFRREAIDARRHQWMGRPLLVQPVSVTVVAVISIIIVALVVGVIVFGRYTNRVRVSGTIVPGAGVTEVFSRQPGHIISGIGEEGTTVKQGDVLYTVSLDDVSSMGETASLVEKQLRIQRETLITALTERARLDAIDKDGLGTQESQLGQELDRLHEQIATTSEYVELLKGLASKYRSLTDRGVTAEREFEAREETYKDNQRQLQSLRRQEVQLLAQRSEVQTKLLGFDTNAALAIGELRQRIAVIEQQLAEGAARHSIDIVAPRDGTLTAVIAKPGQMIIAGAPLVSILPADSTLEVQLWAPSSAVGFVKEGNKVLMRYAAFPYQKFGQYTGVVTKISRVTIKSQDGTEQGDAAAQAQRTASYRISVRPDSQNVIAYGKREPLRAGMAVEAELMLDTRPLYQWILEPLYSLRGFPDTHKGGNFQ